MPPLRRSVTMSDLVHLTLHPLLTPGFELEQIPFQVLTAIPALPSTYLTVNDTGRFCALLESLGLSIVHSTFATRCKRRKVSRSGRTHRLSTTQRLHCRLGLEIWSAYCSRSVGRQRQRWPHPAVYCRRVTVRLDERLVAK